MSFKEQLENNKKEIEKILLEKLPKNCEMQKEIQEAMEYSLMAGGKRLRPMMLLETWRMFSGRQKADETVKCYMAAMEMIHTYSLVHDDLPAMDNDDYRRGRLTTHKQYGEAMGILAGDALLNYAFEVAALGAMKSEDKAAAIKALSVLAGKSGVYGMLGGQVVDVQMEGKEVSPEQLEFIYRLKTGALIEASMEIGAILAGAGDDQIELLKQIALKIGMAFQIQDDILDITSTTQVLGKPVHSDEKNKKMTYVTIYGLEKASRDVELLTGQAVEQMGMLQAENPFLKELLIGLVQRKK